MVDSIGIGRGRGCGGVEVFFPPPPPSIQGQKPLYSCFLCKKCQKYAVIFLKVCPTCCTKFHLRTLKYSKIISQRGGGYGREHSLPLDPPPIHSPCTFSSQAISILGDIQWWVVTFEWSQWELSILEFLSLREVSQRKLSAGSCPGMAFYSVSVENYENTHRTFKLSLLCWNHSYSVLCCPFFVWGGGGGGLCDIPSVTKVVQLFNSVYKILIGVCGTVSSLRWMCTSLLVSLDLFLW